jgi:hypothetical protein
MNVLLKSKRSRSTSGMIIFGFLTKYDLFQLDSGDLTSTIAESITVYCGADW